MRSGGRRTQGITNQFQKNKPFITIVTVVRNGEKTLEQTILSIINQSYLNLEYIIIDGESTDSTLNIIQKYENKIDYWVSESDKGIYDAMNKGIDLMAGEWVNFMNAGDYFYNADTINKTSYYLKDTSKEIVCGNALLFSDYFEVVYIPVEIENIQFRMPFCHQAVFVRRATIKELKYNTSYLSSGDYDFFYRCFILGKQFLYIPEMIACFDMSKGVSKENYRLLKMEDAKVRGKSLNIVEYFIVYAGYIARKIAEHILPIKIIKKIKIKNLQTYFGKHNVIDKTLLKYK